MAVELKIVARGHLCKKKLDFQLLLKRCKLNYGSYNAFYVLQENDGGPVGLLYNPNRMARGIYFEGKQMNEGEVSLRFNLPTTLSEINDFIRVATEIKIQYRSVAMTCDGVDMSIEELIENRDSFLEYSLESLKGFCTNEEYEAGTITLASYPYTLSPEEMEYYARSESLDEFEEMIHQRQSVSAYYASPSLMKKPDSKDVVAFYTFTEGIPSIFPLRANYFLTSEEIHVDRGLVRFYVDSQGEVLDGTFDYEAFIEEVAPRGAWLYDGDHVFIPSLEKEILFEIAENLLKEQKIQESTPASPGYNGESGIQEPIPQ